MAPLHGLRGIAVLVVIASHLGNGKLWLLPFTHDRSGKVGVWVFFVLSAYLLTRKLVASIRSDGVGSIAPYLVHRVFRIFPLYLFVLLLHVWLSGFTAGDFLRHALLLEGKWELWALPVEFTFYAVLPVLALVAARYGTRVGVAVVGALGVASFVWGIASPEEVFSSGLALGPKFLPFAIGAIAAMVEWRPGQVIGIASMACLAVVTVVCRELFVGGLPINAAPWISFAIATLTTTLVASSMTHGLTARMLSWRPFVYLGEVSFSLYLLHMFIIRYAMLVPWSPYLVAWGTLALAVLVATVTYRLIEEPGIRTGRRVAAWLRPRAPELSTGR